MRGPAPAPPAPHMPGACAEATSSLVVVREVVLHACAATLLEVGALGVPGPQPAWQALHLQPTASEQVCGRLKHMLALVLVVLPCRLLACL